MRDLASLHWEILPSDSELESRETLRQSDAMMTAMEDAVFHAAHERIVRANLEMAYRRMTAEEGAREIRAAVLELSALTRAVSVRMRQELGPEIERLKQEARSTLIETIRIEQAEASLQRVESRLGFMVPHLRPIESHPAYYEDDTLEHGPAYASSPYRTPANMRRPKPDAAPPPPPMREIPSGIPIPLSVIASFLIATAFIVAWCMR